MGTKFKEIVPVIPPSEGDSFIGVKKNLDGSEQDARFSFDEFILGLPIAEDLDGSEYLMIFQNGKNVKILLSNLNIGNGGGNQSEYLIYHSSGEDLIYNSSGEDLIYSM